MNWQAPSTSTKTSLLVLPAWPLEADEFDLCFSGAEVLNELGVPLQHFPYVLQF